MRIVTLVLALAAGCAPALAQTAPDSAPPPPLPAAPQAEPAKTQDQVPVSNRENLALPPSPRGRFSFAPVEEGFLRFDHNLGDVALCKPQNGGWTCDAVPDISAARQKEIDDLREQVAALQKEIASLRAPPPHPVPPQTVPPSAEDETGSVTLKQDLARARGLIEQAWSRLVDMIENLRKDLMRKGGDSGTSRT